MSLPDLCYGSDNLLSADDARAALVAAATPLLEIERLHLRDALGRVLAEDIISPLDVPGYDNSAMDGYAVNSTDTLESGVSLKISQRIPAGHEGVALEAGAAARIFTGAPMPMGADAVVMQEECLQEGDDVYIKRQISPLTNVRARANDIALGDKVLLAGDKLKPQSIGLLASLGIAEIKVIRRLRVALINTGDEIIEPGNPLAAGQIYNSNRYSLTATLQEVGCDIIDLGQTEDTFEATRQALLKAASSADLIVTSGGVSVGEEDHVKAAVVAEGELGLWRVRMKPGKPLAFGEVAGTPFIGLPGNPVSAFVTFCLFAMPYVRVAQGQANNFPQAMAARLPYAVEKPLTRREFLRVKLHPQTADLPLAEAFPRQGSDVFSSTLWADGVLEVPDACVFEKGAVLNYWSFERLLG